MLDLRRKLYLFDWVIIGYCSLMVVLILVFGRPIEAYYDEIVFYSSAAVIAGVISSFVDEKKGRFYAFVRLIYPAMMFTFFYRETGGLMFLVFDRFLDWQLVGIEKAVFGVNPTLYIDRHLLNVPVNEIFSFCYFSYYFMIPGFLLPIFIKRHYHVIRSFQAAACLTFFLSYMLFFLYPVEGPRWHFAGEYINGIESPLSRHLVEFVMSNAAVRGGCMPSSHFAMALVILMYCYKYYGKAGWYLLPVVVGLAIGTVWGRFHYVSDVIVGGAIGLVCALLAWKHCRSPVAGSHDTQQRELRTQVAS